MDSDNLVPGGTQPVAALGDDAEGNVARIALALGNDNLAQRGLPACEDLEGFHPAARAGLLRQARAVDAACAYRTAPPQRWGEFNRQARADAARWVAKMLAFLRDRNGYSTEDLIYAAFCDGRGASGNRDFPPVPYDDGYPSAADVVEVVARALAPAGGADEPHCPAAVRVAESLAALRLRSDEDRDSLSDRWSLACTAMCREHGHICSDMVRHVLAAYSLPGGRLLPDAGGSAGPKISEGLVEETAFALADRDENYRLRAIEAGAWDDFRTTARAILEKLAAAWGEPRASGGIGPDDLTVEEQRLLAQTMKARAQHPPTAESGWGFVVQNLIACGFDVSRREPLSAPMIGGTE